MGNADGHEKLLEKYLDLPTKFRLHYEGAHVIFTGAAHAKYQKEILDGSYRPMLVVFIDALLEDIFFRLLDA